MTDLPEDFLQSIKNSRKRNQCQRMQIIGVYPVFQSAFICGFLKPIF